MKATWATYEEFLWKVREVLAPHHLKLLSHNSAFTHLLLKHLLYLHMSSSASLPAPWSLYSFSVLTLTCLLAFIVSYSWCTLIDVSRFPQNKGMPLQWSHCCRCQLVSAMLYFAPLGKSILLKPYCLSLHLEFSGLVLSTSLKECLSPSSLSFFNPSSRSSKPVQKKCFSS